MSRNFLGQRGLAALAGLMVVSAMTGCQVDIGGQTLPSPYYTSDDVQYFPAGPEFPLSEEAAELRRIKLQQENEALIREGRTRPGYTTPPLR